MTHAPLWALKALIWSMAWRIGRAMPVPLAIVGLVLAVVLGLAWSLIRGSRRG